MVGFSEVEKKTVFSAICALIDTFEEEENKVESRWSERNKVVKSLALLSV